MQQSGGGNVYLNDAKTYVGVALFVALVLIITYPQRFSDRLDSRTRFWTSMLQSPLGQTIAVLIVVVIGVWGGLLWGLLVAIAFLLYAQSTKSTTKEGFQPILVTAPESVRRVVPNRHMWFLEEIMNEDPYLIEEEVIRTSAVQDMSEKGVGTVQNSGVQNSSVQTF